MGDAGRDPAAERDAAHGSLDSMSIPRKSDGVVLSLCGRIGWLAAHRQGERTEHGRRELAQAHIALDLMGAPAGDIAARVLALQRLNHEGAAAVIGPRSGAL